MSEMVEFLAPDGTPIDLEEWMNLFEKRREDMSSESWWRKRTDISDEVCILTDWLGMNQQWDDGPPLYWEAMIFGGEFDQRQWRYSSRESALDDHERIVRALRAGHEP